MTKINYDIFLDKLPEHRVGIGPKIAAPYIIQGEYNVPYLSAPNNQGIPWQWFASTIFLSKLDDKYRYLLSFPKEFGVKLRQVVNNQAIINDHFYVEYAKNLFSSIQCGSSRDEMVIKLLGRFSGAEWSEANFILGGIIDTRTSERPLLRCKIEPLYATIQSILPPFEVKHKRKLDVKNWKPKDSMNYQVVWHLMLTLSNGEQHKMYYPICSLSKWHDTMKQYFIENPQTMLSPDFICGVTHYAEGYSYENVINDLKFYEDLTVGVYPSEILIKLSAFFNYPDRAAHLQTILTGNEVELVFSGNVHWI